MVRAVDKLVDLITIVAARVSQIALVFIMLIVVVNVITRRLGIPVPGTVELVEMSGAILLGMAVAYTAKYKGHIMVSVLVERFPPRIQGLIDIVFSSLSLFFIALLTREIFSFASRMMARGYSTGYLQLPLAPSIYLVAIGFAMLALVLIRDIICAFILVLKGSESV